MSTERTEYLSPDLLQPFENNPFQSVDENEYDELRDSIKEFGIITPLIVNKSDNGYEIISGHRRWQIAKELNISSVPVYVRELSKEEAIISFVDCNLCREKILPSEKARAYKMRHDAMKKQGARTDLTSSQVGTKFRSDELLAETMPDSRMQIQRYIRLNNLQKPLLDMVDEGRISFTPAVELSYLTEAEQLDLITTIESEDCTPSLSQAQRMHKLSEENNLTMDAIFEIMQEQKANQKEYVKIPVETFKKYFKKDIPPKKMEEITEKALARYAAFLQKQKQWER
ncbi:MAG: ParB/RepB/Spo0J family partition protein [Acutalibacteraceae bacterium]